MTTAAAGPSRRGFSVGLAAALGGGGLLAAGGAAVLLWPKPVAEPDEAPQPIALGEDTYIARAVDGYDGLRQRLLSYGVPAEQADLAVAALRKVGGANPGQMSLQLRLGQGADGQASLSGADLRRLSDGVGFALRRSADGYTVSVQAARLTRAIVAHPRAQVNRDGLYASAVGSISPELMIQFAEAVAFDFDIAQDVREGDQFELVHEERRDPSGAVVGGQRLIFAFLGAGGKDCSLYRFDPETAEEGWFDDRGRTNRRAFMRTPLDGARITSLFGPRTHPVLHSVRMHKGVDFGCAIGTRIYAAADGVVAYAGPASGFGVLLKIAHEGGLETWYGHLSGFPEGIAQGAAVTQGQVVAFSGNVGLSSGPHLHYEVHKDGVAVDPKDFLDVQGAGGVGAALTGDDLAAMMAFKDDIDIARRSQA